MVVSFTNGTDYPQKKEYTPGLTSFTRNKDDELFCKAFESEAKRHGINTPEELEAFKKRADEARDAYAKASYSSPFLEYHGNPLPNPYVDKFHPDVSVLIPKPRRVNKSLVSKKLNLGSLIKSSPSKSRRFSSSSSSFVSSSFSPSVNLPSSFFRGFSSSSLPSPSPLLSSSSSPAVSSSSILSYRSTHRFFGSGFSTSCRVFASKVFRHWLARR
jgi:hypothetical protein